MDPITSFSSRAVVLPAENVDTDQIIPARFLTVTDKTGLGAALFADWRLDAAGEPDPDFVLNQPEAEGAGILVAGANFGCGSSREHAPWALLGFGFRAIVSTGFADIFRNNALKNGLLPIAVSPEAHARIREIVETTTRASFRVDLETQRLALPDGSEARFRIDAFARHCLLAGQDEMRFLLDQESRIARHEALRPSRISTVAEVAVGASGGEAR